MIRGTSRLGGEKSPHAYSCRECYGYTGKFSPLLVGTAKNPYIFRDEPSPIPYVNQKNACADSDIYRGWWQNIFLPSVRKFTKDSFALLMDNCSWHDPPCTDPTEQVEIIFSTPNCTYQPLDQGIITTLKTRYWREMLLSFAGTYEKFDELQELATYKKVHY